MTQTVTDAPAELGHVRVFELPGYRCYGLMDGRGRWGSWLFGPSTFDELAGLEREAARRNQVLFVSAQTFMPPPEGRRPRRWRQAREHYVGDGALPHLAPLFFDIDCAGDLDKALLAGRYLLEFLVHGLGLAEPAVRVWFSGSKGLHILVHPAALGIEPSAGLTADMKRIVANLVQRLETEGCPELPVDSTVYSLPRMLRAPNQVNPRSGLYKIELHHEELLRLTGDEIKALAAEPRAPLWPDDHPPPALSPTAAAWWAAEIGRLRQVREFTRRTAELTGRKVRPDGFVVDELIDDEMPDCIRRLAAATVAPGNRNRAELQLACWALAAKRPQTWAAKLLAAWAARNRPEFTLDGCRTKADSVVAAVYGRSGYGFSCAAARTAARAAGLEPECPACRTVRQPLLQTLHSLRQNHDEGWTAPERITLHDARARTATFIDRFVARIAGRAGADAAGNGQVLHRQVRLGRPRRPRPVRHADARTG
ncbi:MAG: hypothetical protein JXL80_17920 [Planctomycetes bacterium]|nr:hypothetical protein [Planctomycetota bacterium]